MSRCDHCGADFVALPNAWGDTCGQCLATEIELLLMGQLSANLRKPMKRAAALAPSPRQAAPDDFREVANGRRVPHS